MIIDVNQFDPMRPELHILLKIKYKGARWLQLLEVMATTHFLFAPHLSLVNEFHST